MPVRSEHIAHDMRFQVTVTCDDLAREDAIAKTFDDLEEATRLIETAIRDDEKYYYYNIAIETPTAPDELQPNLGEAFDPWETCGKAFWPVVARDPRFRERIAEHVLRLNFLMCRGGMHEYDETAFGEPVVTLLAMLDVGFVPLYLSLLRRWDLETEVTQFEAIDMIVRKHGLCRETEELLVFRFTEGLGQMGLDQFNELLPFLEEATGDLATTPLFRRIVEGLVPNPVATGPDDTLRYLFDGDLMVAARRMVADRCLAAAERWQPSPG